MEPFAEGTEAIAAAARRKAEWLRAWQDMRNTDDAAALEPLLAQVDDPALKRRVRDRILAAINSATDLHGLRQYTRQFPAGSAVQEAQRRIAVLSTWSQIEASEDLSLFEKFLAQTSDAELADLAKDRIIGLITTLRRGPSSLERPASKSGEPIVKLPAGMTAICGHLGQS